MADFGDDPNEYSDARADYYANKAFYNANQQAQVQNLDDRVSRVYQEVSKYKDARKKLYSILVSYQEKIQSYNEQLNNLQSGVDEIEAIDQERNAYFDLSGLGENSPEVWTLEQKRAKIQEQIEFLKAGIAEIQSIIVKLDEAYTQLRSQASDLPLPTIEDIDAQIHQDKMIPEVDENPPFIDPANYTAIPDAELTNPMALNDLKQVAKAIEPQKKKPNYAPMAIAAAVVYFLLPKGE